MYTAIVTRIRTRPFPDYVSGNKTEKIERLVLGDCLGNQVITNKDTIDGMLGVFFPADGQLSVEFTTANDLVRRKDENGNPAGGMFEENRRVRAITLKGQRSDGFWAPLSLLNFTGDVSHLKEGDTFTAVNGVEICDRYETAATIREKKKNLGVKVKTNDKSNIMFAKHRDTPPGRNIIHTIPAGSVIHLTEKEHGTSGRTGLVWDPSRFGRWRNLFMDLVIWLMSLLGVTLEDSGKWRKVTGTRNTVIGPDHGDRYRNNMVQSLKLHPGEVIYYELVGFTNVGKPIMDPASTDKLNDKSVKKRYGSQITFAYGCSAKGEDDKPQTRLRVYRIANVDRDGTQHELSWNQVRGRAAELGLETVHHLESFVYDGNQEALSAKVEKLVNGSGIEALPSWVDPSHIREGVVLRAETPEGRVIVGKFKSFCFSVVEGYKKDCTDYVDAEESS